MDLTNNEDKEFRKIINDISSEAKSLISSVDVTYKEEKGFHKKENQGFQNDVNFIKNKSVLMNEDLGYEKQNSFVNDNINHSRKNMEALDEKTSNKISNNIHQNSF